MRGYKALIAAVVERAIKDYHRIGSDEYISEKYYYKRGRRREDWTENAREWIQSDSTEEWSLNWCLEELGIPKNKFMEALEKSKGLLEVKRKTQDDRRAVHTREGTRI